jgi:hypothetical protein
LEFGGELQVQLGCSGKFGVEWRYRVLPFMQSHGRGWLVVDVTKIMGFDAVSRQVALWPTPR